MRMAEDTFCLWVNSDRKDINSVDDFVKAAKAKGGDWIMAGTGKSSEDNLLTDFLNSAYGTEHEVRAIQRRRQGRQGIGRQ